MRPLVYVTCVIYINDNTIEPDVRSGEYSVNELEVIDGVKRAAAFVRTHGRPMTAAELRENRRRSEENIRNEQT